MADRDLEVGVPADRTLLIPIRSGMSFFNKSDKVVLRAPMMLQVKHDDGANEPCVAPTFLIVVNITLEFMNWEVLVFGSKNNPLNGCVVSLEELYATPTLATVSLQLCVLLDGKCACVDLNTVSPYIVTSVGTLQEGEYNTADEGHAAFAKRILRVSSMFMLSQGDKAAPMNGPAPPCTAKTPQSRAWFEKLFRFEEQFTVNKTKREQEVKANAVKYAYRKPPSMDEFMVTVDDALEFVSKTPVRVVCSRTMALVLKAVACGMESPSVPKLKSIVASAPHMFCVVVRNDCDGSLAEVWVLAATMVMMSTMVQAKYRLVSTDACVTRLKQYEWEFDKRLNPSTNASD